MTAARRRGGSGRQDDPRRRPRLEDYRRMVTAGWKDVEIYRFMLHDLPRRLLGQEPAVRQAILDRRPERTGTPWDAFLAAVVEHLALLHGLQVPDWVDEPGRFLATPWKPLQEDVSSFDAVAWAPAPFHRHGVPIDGGELDPRGGETAMWRPGDEEDRENFEVMRAAVRRQLDTRRWTSPNTKPGSPEND